MRTARSVSETTTPASRRRTNSKIEVLLVLADALPAYEASDDDLLEMATDIFVADDHEKQELLQILVRDLELVGIDDWDVNDSGWADDLPDLSEDEDDSE